MKTWKELTAEEKGALLLAHHEGNVIEINHNGVWKIAREPIWFEDCIYRVKPVRKVVMMHAGFNGDYSGDAWTGTQFDADTHCITFDMIAGEPDCVSIKMEKIK